MFGIIKTIFIVILIIFILGFILYSIVISKIKSAMPISISFGGVGDGLHTDPYATKTYVVETGENGLIVKSLKGQIQPHLRAETRFDIPGLFTITDTNNNNQWTGTGYTDVNTAKTNNHEMTYTNVMEQTIDDDLIRNRGGPLGDDEYYVVRYHYVDDNGERSWYSEVRDSGHVIQDNTVAIFDNNNNIVNVLCNGNDAMFRCVFDVRLDFDDLGCIDNMMFEEF